MLIERISDQSVEIITPAKINLFLEVLNRRPDGYHNINSLFQAVSLYDRLTFSVSEKPGVTIELDGEIQVTTGQDNLVWQVYRLLDGQFRLPRGLEVILEKNIPVAAGLGGGSSDGAATIAACNLLFNLGLSTGDMVRLSLLIGSDLAFFFSRGQALVTGRGETVKETDFSTDYWIVLVCPGMEISTASSYASLKRGLTISKTPFNLAPGPRVEELVESLQLSGNDFEEIHLESYPELGRIKDELLQAGAALSRMTGSGPSVFGVFSEAPELIGGEAFGRKGWRMHTVLPVLFPTQA
ncbi:MAG: 4-(cytidine 5'-diphospho)-2-C-methyl-D-erythritol kinase [Candidatus Zixiibacteriota bacterium]|nr:MAG: 4-(cytidine 5'-diphospho)-2-C-methyl-D-erythritol kinase [candidate division Zixibacteria bacterium]